MFDQAKHRFLLARILQDVFSDIKIAPFLGFKGGTALMFFYELPRFSVDLDFNLLEPEQEEQVFESVRAILQKYGTIHDQAIKHFGTVLILDYEKGGRKLKIEISNRLFDNHYEPKTFYGTTITVMTAPDMFAHKLCALLDRPALTNRDIFDLWFFLDKQTPINRSLVETRMGMPFAEYLNRCIEAIPKVPKNRLLDGMGDLLNEPLKDFARREMLGETINMLEMLRDF
jgi:predicted nucleotidyltransferase component of viral defense system